MAKMQPFLNAFRLCQRVSSRSTQISFHLATSENLFIVCLIKNKFSIDRSTIFAISSDMSDGCDIPSVLSSEEG